MSQTSSSKWHQVVPSSASHVFAAISQGSVEAKDDCKLVSIWEINPFRRIHRVLLPFDSGGLRLAVSPSGRFICGVEWDTSRIEVVHIGDYVASAWSGRVRKPQRLAFMSEDLLSICTADDGIQIRRSENGKVVTAWPKLVDLHPIMPGKLSIAVSLTGEMQLRSIDERFTVLWSHVLPRRTILRAVADPASHRVFVTEHDVGVRCISLDTGETLWQKSLEDMHVGREMAYCAYLSLLLVYVWNTRSGFGRICAFSPNSGDLVTQLCSYSRWAFCNFLDQGQYCAFRDGTVWRLGSGKIERAWSLSDTDTTWEATECPAIE